MVEGIVLSQSLCQFVGGIVLVSQVLVCDRYKVMLQSLWKELDFQISWRWKKKLIYRCVMLNGVVWFQNWGKIPLADCTIIEDPSSDTFFFDEDSKLCWGEFCKLSYNYWGGYGPKLKLIKKKYSKINHSDSLVHCRSNSHSVLFITDYCCILKIYHINTFNNALMVTITLNLT